MGEIIVPNAVKREANKLYYIDAQGNLCEAILKRGSKTKKEKKGIISKLLNS